MISTFTSGRMARPAISSVRAAIISSESALNRFGSFSVNRTTAPCSARDKSISLTCIPPEFCQAYVREPRRESMSTRMDAQALQSFLARDFGQAAKDFTVQSADAAGVVLKLRVQERHLRPGGTVSGPSMFALADVAMYLAILAQIGPVALSVTTHCSIDFMRKPRADRDLLGQARVLKLGRSLAVGDVHDLFARRSRPGRPCRADLCDPAQGTAEPVRSLFASEKRPSICAPLSITSVE